MNYHPIMAEAETLGVSDVTAFLREELPRRWMADYKDATPRPTNILSIELGTFVYMFDFVTELEIEGVLEPGIVREDRLVAGHGFSTDELRGREAGRMRGWVGPTERYLGPGRDKGHVFGRALGGRVDGLEINLFSQARALNRGWSEEGKLFRKMEQRCERITGTSAIPSLRAAFSRKCPSTTWPSLRASTGILKPNASIEAAIWPTAPSFLRGLRAYGIKRSMGQISICGSAPLKHAIPWVASPVRPSAWLCLVLSPGGTI